MKKTLLRILAFCLAALLLSGCSSKAGVGITKAKINEKGELVLYYSDGGRENLGVVVGEDGKDGKDGLDGIGSSGTVGGEGISAGAVIKGLRSTVSIFCTFVEEDRRGNETEYYGAGSGVIYQLDKEEGDAFIITNYHVVFDPDSRQDNGIAEEIILYLYGGEVPDQEIYATYVGGSQNYDIAVLRVEDSRILRDSAAEAVRIGDSDKVQVGSRAVAIGNPEGEGLSVSSGVISVDSEYIDMTAADNVTSVNFRVMRVDTAVNPGNSGGGLYDANGYLIGIVNAKIVDSDVENIGYALPMATVQAVADNIIDFCYGTDCECVQRPILGVTIMVVSSSAVYDDETGSVVIRETVEVQEVSPGQIGSVFKTGDVLVKATLNGQVKELTRQHHMIDMLLTARPGDRLQVEVLRPGGSVTLELTITEDCLTEY